MPKIRRRWIRVEDEYLRHNYQRVPTPDIAAHLNRPIEAIRSRVRVLGIATTIQERPIIMQGDICLIPLRSRKHPGLYATIDTNQLSLVSQYRWHPILIQFEHNIIYAACTDSSVKPVRRMYMHSIILDTRAEIDHKDGNGLNNRRSNLRTCTRGQNTANQRKRRGTTSSYRGLVWIRSTGKWMSCIRHNGTFTKLGYFTDEKEAALAYDKAATEIHGEFARLNFPNHKRR